MDSLIDGLLNNKKPVDVEKLQLEVDLLKRMLNWYLDIDNPFGGNPKVSIRVEDKGVRSYVSADSDYADEVLILTDEEVAILKRP
jgi:hypothetical protein